MTRQPNEYALGHSERELERLNAQAQAFEPLTRRLLLEAGLAPGMKVLDIGSGAGDVSFLAAELVGETGSVIGVDLSNDGVAHAAERAAAKKLNNVSFVAGELASLPFEREFDAIIGRLVVMYLPEPAKGLKLLLRHLKAGGIVAFHEMDILSLTSMPPAPLIDEARSWVHEAFRRIDADIQTGPKLHAIYRDAGLPSPRIIIEGMAGGAESDVPFLLADVVKALFPVMEAHGIVSAQTAGLETLELRMRTELEETKGIALIPPFFGAWVTAP